MSDEEYSDRIRDLAEAHVDWLLRIIRPLLIEEFVHGHKHGVEDEKENTKAMRDELEECRMAPEFP